jgi:hypothetical protein
MMVNGVTDCLTKIDVLNNFTNIVSNGYQLKMNHTIEVPSMRMIDRVDTLDSRVEST